ncbi:putative helicase [Changchunvirus paulsarasin]|uniref:Helicase n=2 Tax=Changchunvirus TaxID=2842593 RepID=A0AAE7VYU4_9CAUD|nr:DNA helicase [Escherichia phage vB_EcoS_W011D]QCW18495.1 helicase [Escherichia phage vB_EcoS_W011D]QXV83695.1 putative helicase [Escherichia phage PaulSarasin]
MYDFEQKRLSPKDIIDTAESLGVSPLRVAINANGYRQSSSFWGDVQDVNSGNDRYPVISLGNDIDVVGKLSSNIAKSVQFPASSAYMHFVGCVSAAMLGRFTVDYHGTDQPTALYVVTSQPPSTGKSAINSLAIAPMVCEVERINEQRKKERKKIMAKLAGLAKEMKSERSGADMAALYEEKEELEEKLQKLCDVVFPVSDTTPEGLAKINNRQGNFAVISDEATSINSLLGLTYANSERKTNSELVLKAWDAGHVSIARANAENNMSFKALGCMSVIAQDETISGIMEAGSRGIGVSERFLLVREESFLGRRTFIDDDGDSTFEPVDPTLKAQYYQLIHNIMTEAEVSLKISKSAMKCLNRARQEMEPDLADGGKYSHTMLRGALGKMDKQVIRIASVLHVIRNWFNESGSPQKSREIELETMQEALIMFQELSKTYISAANASGHAGDDAEMSKLIDIITRHGKANKGILSVRAIYESARKVKPFLGQAGIMKRIEENLLPMLEDRNYVCVINGRVFVNPALLG